MTKGEGALPERTYGATTAAASNAPVWHAVSVAEVCAALPAAHEEGFDDASPGALRGLDAHTVAARRARYGDNRLPTAAPITLLSVVLHQLRSPLIYILLAAAAVSLALGDRVDAGFILFVVLFNSALGAAQEWRAEQSAAGLQQLITMRARVVRNAREQQIDAAELVPGDLVRIESGQRVPADLRLVHVNALSIDESLLTGESFAVEKALDPRPVEAPLGDRRNMAFAGSTVMAGRGLGLVVAIGTATQLGDIATAVSAADASKPPLVLRLERFAQQISVVVLATCLLIGVIGVARGMPWLEVFLLAVALAVSAIPEGLPVAVTVALSIATRRMAKRKVIVRRLTAVEGLGSCTYIASDKTGTLTVNRQALRRITLVDGRAFSVDGAGDAPIGLVRDADGTTRTVRDSPALARMARVMVECNDATLQDVDGQWQQAGDAVDVALLAGGRKLGLDATAHRAAHEVVASIPYESRRAFAATFVRDGESAVHVSVKGALEALLPHCTAQWHAQGDMPLDRAAISALADALTDDGYRVLAVADATMAAIDTEADAETPTLPPLTLLGLVALIDPARPDAREAVARCRAAGIRVSMVTGDHPRTAFAIARDLGITESSEEIVTGAQLASAGPPDGAQVEALVSSGRVFARVSPRQKLHIVDALRRLGHFVAVTGDGVNDAPALKRANIGVAMGTGSDVTKDAASLIITDDRFASIEAGVEEGRVAYDNIRKVTLMVVSSGAAEVLLLLLSLASGLALPLMAVQLLWLNLVTNGIQDISLAFEAGEDDIMQRPPRRPTDGIFDRRMIEQSLIGGVAMGGVSFAAWAWLLSTGMEESLARNELLLLFVLMQNLHVFNCRSERRSAFGVPLSRNWVLLVGVLGAQGVHLLAMHVPVLQRILGVQPVTASQWGIAVGTAVTILVVMESYKLVRRFVERRP